MTAQAATGQARGNVNLGHRRACLPSTRGAMDAIPANHAHVVTIGHRTTRLHVRPRQGRGGLPAPLARNSTMTTHGRYRSSVMRHAIVCIICR